MRGLARRLEKLENTIRPKMFFDGSVVTKVALKKLSMRERKLLQEARALWREGDRTDEHRIVYERWENALADAITETGFPFRMTAVDWDFIDEDLEAQQRIGQHMNVKGDTEKSSVELRHVD